jgi:Flagellin and related hook-associated proteins
MKISNKLFNDQQLSQFSKNMEKIQKIQDKISSGKNIIFASDDPVGAVQLSEYEGCARKS